MQVGYRQEVFNVVLAQILQERGVISVPEKVIKAVLAKQGARRMPDVMVNFMGLRTVIEGEVSDQPEAKRKALESARRAGDLPAAALITNPDYHQLTYRPYANINT